MIRCTRCGWETDQYSLQGKRCEATTPGGTRCEGLLVSKTTDDAYERAEAPAITQAQLDDMNLKVCIQQLTQQWAQLEELKTRLAVVEARLSDLRNEQHAGRKKTL